MTGRRSGEAQFCRRRSCGHPMSAHADWGCTMCHATQRCLVFVEVEGPVSSDDQNREEKHGAMSALDQLKDLIARDELHHATYRNRGTVWEGIWFYRRDAKGFRGFDVAGCVNKNDPDFEEAFNVLSGKGLHVGCFGGG